MKVTQHHPRPASPRWPSPPPRAHRLHELGLRRRGRGGTTTPITIGISLPLTGDFSEPGKGVQRGYEAWADYVNENGGLLGQRRRADHPRRPVQRRPGRLRLREAHQPGRRRPRLRPLLHPPGGPRRPGGPGLRLPLRRAGRRRRGGLHPGLRQPLLRRPRGRRRPLQLPRRPHRGAARGTSGPRPRRSPRWTTRSRWARPTASRPGSRRWASRPSWTRSTRPTPPTSARSRPRSPTATPTSWSAARSTRTPST